VFLDPLEATLVISIELYDIIIPYFYNFVKSYFLLLVVLRLLPDAVTACCIRAGPVLRLDDEAFSPLVILAATALGLQEG
jgi:hypothetical protein